MLVPLALTVLAAQAALDVAALRADYATLSGVVGAKDLIEPEATFEVTSGKFMASYKIDLREAVLGSSRTTPRLLIERIDVSGRTAEAVVGYARLHKPVLFYRDRWRNAKGGWLLFSREFLTGAPPLVFRDALVVDVLRALDDGKGHEWTLEAGANVRVSLDLTGLDDGEARSKLLSAAGAKEEPVPYGGTWIVPTRPGPRDPGAAILSSVELVAAEVRPSLRQIFKQVTQSYTIDPDVQGTVSLDLLDVPMEVALLTIVRQVHATYRIEGGVYQVLNPQDPDRTPPHRPRRIIIDPT